MRAWNTGPRSRSDLRKYANPYMLSIRSIAYGLTLELLGNTPEQPLKWCPKIGI
jgi:hypothetical protein